MKRDWIRYYTRKPTWNGKAAYVTRIYVHLKSSQISAHYVNADGLTTWEKPKSRGDPIHLSLKHSFSSNASNPLGLHNPTVSLILFTTRRQRTKKNKKRTRKKDDVISYFRHEWGCRSGWKKLIAIRQNEHNFCPFSAGRQSHLCVAGSPMKLVNTRPLCLDVHSCPAK